MASESTIRKRAREEAEEMDWTYWIPARTKWHSNDIFEVFDLIGWKDSSIHFVQYTSRSNVSARVNSVINFLREGDLGIPENIYIHVWGYENRKGFTRKEELTNKDI